MFFLFFIATAAGVEACASGPAALPDPAPNHACCAVAGEEGKLPAGKNPTWSVALHCHGNLCCCTSGGSQAVAASPTVVSDQLLLRRPPEVLHYVMSLSPAVVSAPDKPPLNPFPPLYIRNCAFLI